MSSSRYPSNTDRSLPGMRVADSSCDVSAHDFTSAESQGAFAMASNDSTLRTLHDVPTHGFVPPTSHCTDLDYPSRIPHGWLTDNQLIPPSELPGKRLGVDCCLLVHQPRLATATIFTRNGLRTLAQRAHDPDAAEADIERYNSCLSTDFLSYDPSLVYLKPLSTKSFAIWREDVVFAVSPDIVQVFNEEGRNDVYRPPEQRYTSNLESRMLYMKHSMPYRDFMQRSASAPSGFLDKNGDPWPAGATFSRYEPEVLLRPSKRRACYDLKCLTLSFPISWKRRA